mmetsp:Transcript_117302/g.343546  ORF Transcript_117302/g.343546 Transcript_117302/m.343546 type:complete len:300 (-) Transcript_117302:698-1597(-)
MALVFQIRRDAPLEVLDTRAREEPEDHPRVLGHGGREGVDVLLQADRHEHRSGKEEPGDDALQELNRDREEDARVHQWDQSQEGHAPGGHVHLDQGEDRVVEEASEVGLEAEERGVDARRPVLGTAEVVVVLLALKEELVPQSSPHDGPDDWVPAHPEAGQPVLTICEGLVVDELAAAWLLGALLPLEVAGLHHHRLQGVFFQAPSFGSLVAAPALHDAVADGQQSRRLEEQHDQEHEYHHVYQLKGLKEGVVVHNLLRVEDLGGKSVSDGEPVHEVEQEANEAEDSDLLKQRIQDVQL